MGGLMDYKARFYSSYINHFLQPDTLIPDPSNPQAWNRYSYVMNRPVNFNDPTGHVFEQGTGFGGNGCTLDCQLAKRKNSKDKYGGEPSVPLACFQSGLSTQFTDPSTQTPAPSVTSP